MWRLWSSIRWRDNHINASRRKHVESTNDDRLMLQDKIFARILTPKSFPVHTKTEKCCFPKSVLEAEVSKSSGIIVLFWCLHVGQRPNRRENPLVTKIPMHVWTWPFSFILLQPRTSRDWSKKFAVNNPIHGWVWIEYLITERFFNIPVWDIGWSNTTTRTLVTCEQNHNKALAF